MTRLSTLTAIFALATAPALADEVTDTLSSALQAYEEGDISYAIEELDYAKSLMRAMKTTALEQFLPEPPAGYELEVDTDMGTGMAMMGGGVGTEGTYSNGSDRFSISIMVDNPMVTAFGGMLANAAMLGMKVERVGREKFIVDDDEITGLIDGRILVRAEGGDSAIVMEALKTMDFKALSDFGG
ncbi:hypothetical protein [Maritimibacter sp. UBA3975]|uniref:hypothetical protein n=1 Tax=Maritimibacter sp. UBA3975 TaxID=1946833 RepID=UPI0025C716FB|nr:hypothetical protein [Maritimibacter sp. UBA3975]|tara:strand:+ start:238 stop:792 length:555 start_codon:yes stop_codon:yes gene_type:complete